MKNTSFLISLEDGIAQLQLTPSDSSNTPVKWTEDLLQHILALNPQLLDVYDHLPLKLDGGSTEVSPDQLYIDDCGRLVIIEIKNESAKMSALAQLIAYSEHYSIMPLGELERGFFKIAERGTCADVMQNSLSKLRSWSEPILLNKTYSEDCCTTQWKAWPFSDVKSLDEFAKNHWGNYACCLRGAPSRLVLIAPDFSKECIDFAEYLRKRFVPIDMFRANLYNNSKHGITLSFSSALDLNHQIEPTWKIARKILQIETIRKHFAVNAWADHLNYASFSFSAYDAAQARFWISADNHQGTLSTVIPDGWCPGTSQKNKLRQLLLDRLPGGFSLKDRVWLRQEFAFPRQQEELLDCAMKLAEVVRKVLVPHAPRS